MADVLPFVISESQGWDFKIIEAGQFPARCYAVIDLGTHDTEYQGVAKKRREVRFTFEFPTETDTFKEWEPPRPFSISRTFTYSLGEKSNLRPFLESWRGRKFTDEELKGFDISKLLWVPLFVNVTHETSKKGKKFANIGSVMPLPKGMECPEQVNENILYSPYSHDENTFARLHQRTQETILASDEMKARLSVPTTPDNGKKKVSIDDVPF